MRKLSDYVETAAEEYFAETGSEELDALWIAEFFQDCGVLDDHPHVNLVDFYAQVQKALTLNLERVRKLERLKSGKCKREQ